MLAYQGRRYIQTGLLNPVTLSLPALLPFPFSPPSPSCGMKRLPPGVTQSERPPGTRSWQAAAAPTVQSCSQFVLMVVLICQSWDKPRLGLFCLKCFLSHRK